MSKNQDPAAASISATNQRKSGRASFDDDGRGIWEWQTATGVFERTITDEQLKKLEASDLALAEPEPTSAGKLWPSGASRARAGGQKR